MLSSLFQVSLMMRCPGCLVCRRLRDLENKIKLFHSSELFHAQVVGFHCL